MIGRILRSLTKERNTCSCTEEDGIKYAQLKEAFQIFIRTVKQNTDWSSGITCNLLISHWEDE